MSTIEKFGRNLQFSAYLRLVMVLSGLFLTPFILRRVDLGLYGLNVLIVSLVGYFNILNLGFNSGISRFTAVFFGEGKKGEISDILRFGIRFFVPVGFFVAISLFIISFFYERLFHVEPHLVIKGRILLLIYSMSSIFMWAIIPFREILNGLQRLDITNKVGLAVSILNISLAIIILTYSNSYLLYLGLLQLFTIIVSCANIIFVLRLLPNFRFDFSPISKSLKDRLFKFSAWYFVGGIFGFIIYQIDYFIIGAFLGVNAVAIYSIAFVIHNYIRGLSNLVSGPLYPVITAEFAKQNMNNKNAIVLSATRMHSGILIPVLIIMLINTDNFILAWVGDRFSASILPCKILLSYWFFNITTAILTQGVVGGKGKVAEPVKINGFMAIANLGLSLLLVKFIGITGVALGTAIPWIAVSGFYIYRFCKILSIAVSEFIGKAVFPNIPHFLLSLVLSVAAQKIIKTQNVIQVIAVMTVIYGLSQTFGYVLLSSEDKRIIKKIIRLRA